MIDIYSRYIVGAVVHAQESGPLALEMMKEIFGIHGVPQVVHADRGTSMTSKTVAALLSDLEVTRSHSRPKVSNDNVYWDNRAKGTFHYFMACEALCLGCIPNGRQSLVCHWAGVSARPLSARARSASSGVVRATPGSLVTRIPPRG